MPVKIRRYWLGAFLLLTVAVAVPVLVHLQWVDAVERRYADVIRGQSDAEQNQGDTDSEETWPDTEKKYRVAGHPQRTGKTVVKIAPSSRDSDDKWRATVDHTLRLQPGDPFLSDLRSDAAFVSDWLPFSDLAVKTAYFDCQPIPFFLDDATKPITQDGPKAAAEVLATSDMEWREIDSLCDGEYYPPPDAVITLAVLKDWTGEKGLYDRWTLSVESKSRNIIALRGGTALRQSATGAEVALPAKGKVTVLLGKPDRPKMQDRSDLENLATGLQSSSAGAREAAFLLMAVTTVTCCWAVPFVNRWAPRSTRRRWTGATVAGGTVTGVVLVLALAGSDGWPPEGGWGYPGRGVPLAVWWGVLLPYLLAVFAVRVITGGPPGLLLLLPALTVSFGMLLQFDNPVVGDGRTAVMVAASGVLVALVAYALRRGLAGLTGRRWAYTAAVGVWLAAMAAGPGTGSSLAWYGWWGGMDVAGSWFASSWFASSNMTAGFVLTCYWLIALALPLAAITPRRLRLLLLALMVLLGLATWPDFSFGWVPSGDSSWWALGIPPGRAANEPLVVMQTGVLGIALLLAWRYGRTQGDWPPYVRTVIQALGITAVTTQLTLSGFSAFGATTQRSGNYLAVAIAAAGFAWLLPLTAEARALRRHTTSPHAHNRIIHALLKDQTLAAGRREFLTSSRAALADGELTRRQWSVRWQRLGALGARGMAPQHSVELRKAALSTSGGRSAWHNGLAAASLLAILDLPWLVYTLLPELIRADWDPDDILEVGNSALCWPLYGFIYGYAYSWLRGGTPISKAMCLLAVVLPVEYAQLLFQDLTPKRFGLSLLLTTGNCLAVFLVLGLYWEARVVRVAGLRWGQIRNFRSLSALAVPATTVIVAVATALTTAAVGIWVSPGGPASDVPKEPSPSATPTPGSSGHR
ncbi:hypothetical protein [Streptomyces sp. NPDC000618]|uniref:hypothetical protein n=1 Tax=Streptomyces sp. NPDC000618 TaxID=3154265 RepID=UPI003330D77C